MTDQTSDSPILDLLTTMNLAGIEASTLDAQSLCWCAWPLSWR